MPLLCNVTHDVTSAHGKISKFKQRLNLRYTTLFGSFCFNLYQYSQSLFKYFQSIMTTPAVSCISMTGTLKENGRVLAVSSTTKAVVQFYKQSFSYCLSSCLVQNFVLKSPLFPHETELAVLNQMIKTESATIISSRIYSQIYPFFC